MPDSYSSHDVVEGFLCYNLLSGGMAWRFYRDVSALLPWRSEPAMVTHGGVAPGYLQQAPPRLLAALQSACHELEGRYQGDLYAQVVALQRGEGGGAVWRWRLKTVTDELFRDGMNWGRVVVMMALGGALSREAVRTGETDQVDVIADWLEESLDSPRLRRWMGDNGGWDAFVELYESRPAVPFWTPRTVFGLVALGAAFITLGVLLTQR
ncbi:apoptosis regulator Bcl-2 [Kryptolebias marmoratus]|uniref:Apoptosis regulator Bcl-2-like n=1 Tax=Kryptolebias marmoratus TaxID=37003 RepID=A0A3Q2ZTM7_KRYMA|nr:apoptosis regulator Bcl-2 [Kryptolebias marmoratus]